jgi:hypothetical protein
MGKPGFWVGGKPDPPRELGQGDSALFDRRKENLMKMRTWALLGMLLVGATSWSEQPQDQEEKLISPRAKLELAELDHQADRAELLESLTLLKRGERDNLLRQERSEESRKQRQSELDSL